jgi:hypothetical protein
MRLQILGLILVQKLLQEIELAIRLEFLGRQQQQTYQQQQQLFPPPILLFQLQVQLQQLLKLLVQYLGFEFKLQNYLDQRYSHHLFSLIIQVRHFDYHQEHLGLQEVVLHFEHLHHQSQH